MKNILITSVGKRVALVRAFQENLQRFFPDGKVYAVDMNPQMAPAAYIADECFEVPKVTDANYISSILEICKRNEIGMIIPTIDTGLIVLAENKALFDDAGIALVLSDVDVVKLFRDKRKTNVFFEDRRIKISRPVDVKGIIEFPIFAKPYDGSQSQNLHVIRSRDSLIPEVVNDEKLMFMEYVDKNIYKEFSADMYYGRDHHVKCIVPRERIEVRAGEITKGVTAKNELVEYLRQHFEYIEGCVGCICVQLFYRAETHNVIGIEINPRFGGGYPLSYMAGANYPEMLIREYFLNEKIEYFDAWRDGMFMLRYDDAVYV